MLCFCASVKSNCTDLAFIAFLCTDLSVLLRPRTAVMATKTRHVSEVMATVQISVVAEEKRATDPFFGFWIFIMQNNSVYLTCTHNEHD